MERDNDRSGTSIAGELMFWALLALALLVVGSCIAGR
jgi:hypothetical protein